MLLFIIAITWFSAGFKNVDYSANMMVIVEYYDLDIIGDMGVNGGFHTLEEWYLTGLRQLYLSYHLFMVCFIALFFYLLYVRFYENDFKKALKNGSKQKN